MAACRYCGKSLPLLERISGPGAFCSREHRQRFQDECSRLALKRLLGEDEDARVPAIAVTVGRSKTVGAATAAVAELVAVSAPAVERAIPASPDLVALRRGTRPRLPALEWIWRVDWEETLLPARGSESPAAPVPPRSPALAKTAPAIENDAVAVAPPAAETAARIPAPVVEPKLAPARTRQAEAVETEAPVFASSVGASFWSRMPMAACVGVLAAAVVLFGAAAYRFLGGEPAPVLATAQSDLVRSAPMGPGGWFNKDMPDRTGQRVRAGTFSIYRPSLELTDYRVEFSGRIEQSSLGWFVRFTDPDNYQAMKLTEQGGSLKLARWLVFEGENTALDEQTLPALGSGFRNHRVRVDVKGPRYTVQVDGQQAGLWVDDRLRRGGFGFLNEGDERGRIESVQLFLLGQ